MARDRKERELEKERRRREEEQASLKELEELSKGFDFKHFKLKNPSMLESRLKYLPTPGKDMTVLKSPKKTKTRSVVPDPGPPESQTFFPFKESVYGKKLDDNEEQGNNYIYLTRNKHSHVLLKPR